MTYFEHGKSLLKQLIDGDYEVLMIELNFIEGEHRDLIARLRSKKQLQDLFVVVYAPSEMSKEEQARANGVNAVLTAPFTDSKIVSLFKRAFSLPKQCLFISSSSHDEFSAALTSMGYDFQQIISAKDALEDQSPEVPDFMVIDYSLSDMKGIEFVEEQRNVIV